jgi:hypothetical protein
MSDDYDSNPLKRGDLQFTYNDHASPGDNPHIRGPVDSKRLSRKESYEVLRYVNKFAQTYKTELSPFDTAIKAEWLLHKVVPPDMHERVDIERRILSKWDDYQKV